MREINFTTPDVDNTDVPDEDRIDLPINGQTFSAYRPTPNAVALVMTAIGGRELSSKMAGIMRFLQRHIDREAFDILYKAVEDEALEYAELLELTQEIVAEFGGNPTTSSNASSGSRSTTGRSSMGSSRQPASKRQPSRSTAS